MNVHRHFNFAAIFVLLALAGCAVGPDYRRPVVDAPAFKETGVWKPAEPREQRFTWEMVGSLWRSRAQRSRGSP